jgi:hypothetical protein
VGGRGGGGGGRGRVSRAGGEEDTCAVVVALRHGVRRGDGLVFDVGRPEDGELGGRVFGVWPAAGGSWGREDREELPDGGAAGDTVGLTFDNALSARLRRHVPLGVGRKASKGQDGKAPRLKVRHLRPRILPLLHVSAPSCFNRCMFCFVFVCLFQANVFFSHRTARASKVRCLHA